MTKWGSLRYNNMAYKLQYKALGRQAGCFSELLNSLSCQWRSRSVFGVALSWKIANDVALRPLGMWGR